MTAESKNKASSTHEKLMVWSVASSPAGYKR
jgi:hypothetical protein